MILKLNKPYALNLGEDLEFIQMYLKGKKKKHDITEYRPLFKGLKTGQLYLFIPDERELFGKKVMQINLIMDQEINIKPDGTIKNKVYNYYPSTGNQKLEEIFDRWKSLDSWVHVGNCQHNNISKVKGYTFAYEFNGKKW